MTLTKFLVMLEKICMSNSMLNLKKKHPAVSKCACSREIKNLSFIKCSITDEVLATLTPVAQKRLIMHRSIIIPLIVGSHTLI